MVFDREAVFIGSFNLDPRSAWINTEAGLYIESPELAERLVTYVATGVVPANSYHVLLDPNGEVVWEDAKTRKQLLESGMQLYELRPDSTPSGRAYWDSASTVPIGAIVDRAYGPRSQCHRGEDSDDVVEFIRWRVAQLKEELLVESPYFVLPAGAQATVKALHECNVRMRVLTDSLASNDVLPAHSGY